MRIIGAVFILAACLLYGGGKAYSLCLREKKLKKLLKFINSLSEEMRLSRAELPKLLADIPESAELLENGALRETEGLKAEDVAVLQSYISALGKTDIEGQMQSAKLHTEALKVRLSEASEERRLKSKLYLSLSFLGGLFAVVLII